MYALGSKDYGTSTTLRHMDVIVNLKKRIEIGVIMLDHEGNMRCRQIDHNILRRKFASIIIKLDLPHFFV